MAGNGGGIGHEISEEIYYAVFGEENLILLTDDTEAAVHKFLNTANCRGMYKVKSLKELAELVANGGVVL